MIQIVLSLASCNTLNLGNWNSGFVKLGVRWAELILEDKKNKTKHANKKGKTCFKKSWMFGFVLPKLRIIHVGSGEQFRIMIVV